MSRKEENKTYLSPYPGAFKQRFVPSVGHLPAYFQNILIPGSPPRGGGGGGGMGIAGISASNDDFNGFSLFAFFFEIKGYFTEKTIQ